MSTKSSSLAASAHSSTPTSNFPTLSDVRETCTFVTNRAQHVRLNHQNLKNFAQTITAPPEHWLATNPHNLLNLPLPLLTTVLLYFEVIDFSFWPDPPNNSSTKLNAKSLRPIQKSHQKWTVQTPSGPLDGSVALLYLLIKNFQQNPALDFSTFSDADFYNFFHSTNRLTNHPSGPQTPEIPLLAERSEILRATSHIIRDRLNNNFYVAINNFTSDEQLFHFLITTFPSLHDQRTYTPQTSKTSPDNPATTSKNSKTIHLYKLAQLLASDLLFVRHHIKNTPVDTSHLPGCADYKIPQTLRVLNLISYDEELSQLVDTEQLIPENSPYEVEIRTATISAIDFLHAELPKLAPIQINDCLFLSSRKLSKKQPYHRTRTTNY